MTPTTIRLLFAGVFGMTALFGAVAIELMGQECPPWLIVLVGAAGGFVFGHAQANGLTGKH